MGGYSNSNGLGYYGRALFTANTAQLSIGAVTSNLTFQPTAQGGLTATITYSANVPSIFSGIVGINSFPVSGTAQAMANPITYINYYIVVDVSQSMGLAATATDMTNLYNRVKAYNNSVGNDAGLGCVFGCHVRAMVESW